MKKGVFIFAGILVILLSLFVSARSFGGLDLRQGWSQIIEWIEDFLGPVFEVLLGTGQFEEFFFAKILLLLLVFMIILTILKEVPLFKDKKTISFLVAVIVSVLAIRYIPENDFFEGILIPYSTLGIAITVFLPFLIYFFFVHQSVPGTFGRRAAWAVFAAVFLVLWYLRSDQAGIGTNTIYTIGVVLVILALIFDKSIHKYFGYADFRRSERAINDSQIVKILNDYKAAKDAYAINSKNKAAEREMKRCAKLLKKYHVDFD